MNYPTGIKKSHNQIINYSHRGMNLEDDINQTNTYYREKNIDTKLAISVSIFGIIGAIIGAKFAVNTDVQKLRKLFGIFLAIIAIHEIYTLFKEYKQHKNRNNKIS